MLVLSGTHTINAKLNNWKWLNTGLPGSSPTDRETRNIGDMLQHLNWHRLEDCCKQA